jgi:hypothetical protein
VKWFVTLTVQTTAPPPPLPDPLHCCTVVTGCDEIDVVVVQVSVLSGPVAPTHLVIVSVEGAIGENAPEASTKLTTVTVHATSVPPPFISPLH